MYSLEGPIKLDQYIKYTSPNRIDDSQMASLTGHRWQGVTLSSYHALDDFRLNMY